MMQPENVQHAIANDFLCSTESPLRFNTNHSGHDDGLLPFLAVRRNLFGIAYRMLRCASEAEDIVQEVWLRWQSTNQSLILDPPAFLGTVTIRLCITLSQSARLRRERYVGPWLSEPVDVSAEPDLRTERKEALMSAVLILLEKLGPVERAVYVLREGFDYSYRKIAGILRMKEPTVRQLSTRARRHISQGHRAPVGSTGRRPFIDALIDAAQNGNMARLEGFLSSDAMSYANRVSLHCENRGAKADREQLHPKSNLTWRHKTMGRSVLCE